MNKSAIRNPQSEIIFGVGLVMVSHAEFSKKMGTNGKSFLKKVFTAHEQQYCNGKRSAFSHYSARWACKKAALQALGLPQNVGNMSKVEVLSHSDGRPRVNVDPKLIARRKCCIQDIKVSLSHSDKFAVADVIIMGGAKG